MQAPGVVVDVSDPQALTGKVAIREASREKLTGGLEAVELQREFGTLISHACGSTENRWAGRFQPDRVWSQFLSILNETIRLTLQ